MTRGLVGAARQVQRDAWRRTVANQLVRVAQWLVRGTLGGVGKSFLNVSSGTLYESASGELLILRPVADADQMTLTLRVTKYAALPAATTLTLGEARTLGWTLIDYANAGPHD